MTHPIRRARTISQFLRKGLPKISMTSRHRKTTPPRPRYEMLPKGSMTSPLPSQSSVGDDAQEKPPPQVFMPMPSSDTPTRNTVSPAIQGGKSLRSTWVGRNEAATVIHQHIKLVPKNLPYASFQLVPASCMWRREVCLRVKVQTCAGSLEPLLCCFHLQINQSQHALSALILPCGA